MTVADLLVRIVSGESHRRTRFHDEKGQLISASALRYLPQALVSTGLNRLVGYRPRAPWISYRAAKRLGSLIGSDWNILEFGSGMSTLWLAQRCGFLHSVESNEVWYRMTLASVQARHLQHVELTFRQDASYWDLSAHPDGFFHFALIDGIRRSDCAAAVVPKMRPGGWVYLDNSDRSGATPPSPDMQRAEEILRGAAQERGGSVHSFVDYAPTSFVVTEGLLVRL